MKDYHVATFQTSNCFNFGEVLGALKAIINGKSLKKSYFLTIARFFFRARALVFLAEQDKKNFFSCRNFGYKEFYFLKGKKLAMVKKMVF